MDPREDIIVKGYRYYCPGCRTIYKNIPTEPYEDGYGGRTLVMCRKCHCDLIRNLSDDELAYLDKED